MALEDFPPKMNQHCVGMCTSGIEAVSVSVTNEMVFSFVFRLNWNNLAEQ